MMKMGKRSGSISSSGRNSIAYLHDLGEGGREWQWCSDAVVQILGQLPRAKVGTAWTVG